MSLDKTKLLDFLEVLDGNLPKKIRLIAVGGTALTLLDVKASTIDIDFTIPDGDFEEFEKALTSTPHGFRIDRWKDGVVFAVNLPDDYLKNSIPIAFDANNIELRTISPVDIIVTKIARLNERDQQDIEMCISKFDVKKDEIIERAKQIEYVGNDQAYDANLSMTINTYFS